MITLYITGSYTSVVALFTHIGLIESCLTCLIPSSYFRIKVITEYLYIGKSRNPFISENNINTFLT